MQLTTDEMRQHNKERKEAHRDEVSRENKDFVQVYPKGWERISQLIGDNPTAAKVYVILAQNIDPQDGTVVVSQEVLADMVNVSVRTISRATIYLEKTHALVRIRVAGSVYAYALKPDEIWKSWDKNKTHAAFRTRTMVRKDEATKRRLSVMIKNGMGEPELPFEDDDKTDATD